MPVADKNETWDLPFESQAEAIDLDRANQQLENLTAQQRIDWAAWTFKSAVYGLTSAGIDAVLTVDHLARSPKRIPVIHINTGFLRPEVLDFRNQLKSLYGFTLHEVGPSDSDIAKIKAENLWDTDLEEYRRLTKLQPLAKAIGGLGVGVLISGLRGDQTENRANLPYVRRGQDGELRVHPFIDWTQDEVDNYIDSRGLPRNPLHELGFKTTDDAQLLVPGDTPKIECGMHLENGRLVRNSN